MLALGTPAPPFALPEPATGATVSLDELTGRALVVTFIGNRPLAEGAIHISSNPPVPGKFYWMNDRQVRWRPFDFWPAQTTVNIDAAAASPASPPGTR